MATFEADTFRLEAMAAVSVAFWAAPKLDALTPPVEWTAAPLIGQCCRAFLASFKIWNAATVGGNICMSLPAGPMISLTAALDGVATLWAPDGTERRVTIADFVKGPLSNALRDGELMRSIFLPTAALTARTAFRQISLAHHGRSGALVIGRLSVNGAFALTVTASTPRPVKLEFDTLPSLEILHARIEAAVAELGREVATDYWAARRHPDSSLTAGPSGAPWRRAWARPDAVKVADRTPRDRWPN